MCVHARAQKEKKKSFVVLTSEFKLTAATAYIHVFMGSLKDNSICHGCHWVYAPPSQYKLPEPSLYTFTLLAYTCTGVLPLSLSSCLSSGRQRFAFLSIHKHRGMGYLRSIAIDCDFAVVLASEQRVHRESFRLFVNANPHQTKKIRACTTEIKYL